MPSFDLFEAQAADYKEGVLPRAVEKRLAVETGASFGWDRFVGLDGKVIGLDHFGASAPGDILMKKFGFTVDNIIAQVKDMLNN
ncbi:MAG: transketolase-like TK C-terminal-containing protein, partial [Bacillota bacterium]